jgi:hypothetical protein
VGERDLPVVEFGGFLYDKAVALPGYFRFVPHVLHACPPIALLLRGSPRR